MSLLSSIRLLFFTAFCIVSAIASISTTTFVGADAVVPNCTGGTATLSGLSSVGVIHVWSNHSTNCHVTISDCSGVTQIVVQDLVTTGGSGTASLTIKNIQCTNTGATTGGIDPCVLFAKLSRLDSILVENVHRPSLSATSVSDTAYYSVIAHTNWLEYNQNYTVRSCSIGGSASVNGIGKSLYVNVIYSTLMTRFNDYYLVENCSVTGAYEAVGDASISGSTEFVETSILHVDTSWTTGVVNFMVRDCFVSASQHTPRSHVYARIVYFSGNMNTATSGPNSKFVVARNRIAPVLLNSPNHEVSVEVVRVTTLSGWEYVEFSDNVIDDALYTPSSGASGLIRANIAARFSICSFSGAMSASTVDGTKLLVTRNSMRPPPLQLAGNGPVNYEIFASLGTAADVTNFHFVEFTDNRLDAINMIESTSSVMTAIVRLRGSLNAAGGAARTSDAVIFSRNAMQVTNATAAGADNYAMMFYMSNDVSSQLNSWTIFDNVLCNLNLETTSGECLARIASVMSIHAGEDEATSMIWFRNNTMRNVTLRSTSYSAIRGFISNTQSSKAATLIFEDFFTDQIWLYSSQYSRAIAVHLSTPAFMPTTKIILRNIQLHVNLMQLTGTDYQINILYVENSVSSWNSMLVSGCIIDISNVTLPATETTKIAVLRLGQRLPTAVKSISLWNNEIVLPGNHIHNPEITILSLNQAHLPSAPDLKINLVGNKLTAPPLSVAPSFVPYCLSARDCSIVRLDASCEAVGTFNMSLNVIPVSIGAGSMIAFGAEGFNTNKAALYFERNTLNSSSGSQILASTGVADGVYHSLDGTRVTLGCNFWDENAERTLRIAYHQTSVPFRLICSATKSRTFTKQLTRTASHELTATHHPTRTHTVSLIPPTTTSSTTTLAPPTTSTTTVATTTTTTSVAMTTTTAAGGSTATDPSSTTATTTTTTSTDTGIPSSTTTAATSSSTPPATTTTIATSSTAATTTSSTDSSVVTSSPPQPSPPPPPTWPPPAPTSPPPPATTAAPTTTTTPAPTTTAAPIGAVLTLNPNAGTNSVEDKKKLVDAIAANSSKVAAGIAADIKAKFGLDVEVTSVAATGPDGTELAVTINVIGGGTPENSKKLDEVFGSVSTEKDIAWMSQSVIAMNSDAPSGIRVRGVKLEGAAATHPTPEPPPPPPAHCFIGNCPATYAVISILALLLIIAAVLITRRYLAYREEKRIALEAEEEMLQRREGYAINDAFVAVPQMQVDATTDDVRVTGDAKQQLEDLRRGGAGGVQLERDPSIGDL